MHILRFASGRHWVGNVNTAWHKPSHGTYELLQADVTNMVQMFVRTDVFVVTLCDAKSSAAAKAVGALVEQKHKCRNRAYQSNAERPEISSTSFQTLQNGQRYSLCRTRGFDSMILMTTVVPG